MTTGTGAHLRCSLQTVVETVQWKKQQNQVFKGFAETFLLFVKVNFERLWKYFFPDRIVFVKKVSLDIKLKKCIWLGDLVPQKLNDLEFRPTMIATNAYIVGHH